MIRHDAFAMMFIVMEGFSASRRLRDTLHFCYKIGTFDMILPHATSLFSKDSYEFL